MVDKINGGKAAENIRREVKETPLENGGKEKTVSVFMNEKLQQKIVSTDQNGDGITDKKQTEFYHEGFFGKTPDEPNYKTFEYFDEKGRITERNVVSKKGNERKQLYTYDDENNKRRIESQKNGKPLFAGEQQYNAEGKVVRTDWDVNADGKIDHYVEHTYTEYEDTDVQLNTKKNMKGEIIEETRVETDKNGNIKNIERL